MTHPLSLTDHVTEILDDMRVFLEDAGWRLKRENFAGGTLVMEGQGRRLVIGANLYDVRDGTPIVSSKTVRFPVMGEYVERQVEVLLPDPPNPAPASDRAEMIERLFSNLDDAVLTALWDRIRAVNAEVTE